MRGMTFAAVVAAVSSGAYAADKAPADKPVIGPAPAWVRPVAPTAAAKADEAAVRVLLSDQQVALEPGRQTVYSALTLRIQTPQGLAAGNISVPWRPDTDVLSVHKLLIRRGAQAIDVLASGQTFTVVRREQNLESATLDGVLTANIQPEGLQVGDILEFASSVTSSDPVMRGHVEAIAGAWNGFPIGRAHLRLQWPAAVPVRVRATGPLAMPKPVKANGVTNVEWTIDGVEPVAPPRGAPPRYRIGRLVESTDFASWADLSALMAPLFGKAAVLPAAGPLRAELERIRGASSDPRVRAEAALALVQDRIRYVALAMGAGGLVPADAATTWSRRYGDCKAKTALLLALLRELGIAVDAVLVSTTYGDGLDARLPMIGLFDHVIVRAEIAGRTYWLDGTRSGDTGLDRLTTPAFGWGLPVAPSEAVLVRMVPAPLDVPGRSVTIRIDASAGLSAPAPARIETILHGDEAVGANAGLVNLAVDARDRALREYWKGQYDFIEVKTVGAAFDAKTGEERLTMEGVASMDWSGGSYETDGTSVGYRADFARDPGSDRDAPFAVPYPYFTRTQETILLPRERGDFKPDVGIEVDQTTAGIHYRRHATIAGDVFTIEKSERAVVPEFAAADAPAAQAALRALADRPARLRRPRGYEATDKEVAAASATTPTTSGDYGERASLFVGRGMRKEAVADYGKAIALDPGNVWAWSNRGITRIQLGDLAGARADLDKAAAIDPAYVQVFIGRGMLADLEHGPEEAISAYTRALQSEPGNGYALEKRAAAYVARGDREHAEADLTAAIAASPDNAARYVNRGNLMLDAERYGEAIKDFDAASAIDPRNVWALANRGLARAWTGDVAAATKDLDAAAAIDPENAVVFRARGVLAQRKGAPREAIAAYTRALAIDPASGFALGHRAKAHRAAGDDAAALRDAAAAIGQIPGWAQMYLLRANIFRGQGRQAAALAEAAAVAAANPKDVYAQVTAANIYVALHRDAEAMRAYDRAIAIKPEAYVYFNRSLARPKADVAGRRADLDAALKLEPGFVPAVSAKADLQAEGGDMAGAVATYSVALERMPASPVLLTGRGIAYARGGDGKRADSDFAAARAKTADATSLNDMCWAKATAGVALESAVADCDAALRTTPDQRTRRAKSLGLP